MTRKGWLITALFLVLIAIAYAVITLEVETITTPEIVITINPHGYVIDGRASNDIVPLLTEEIEIRKPPEPFNIILSADKKIQYEKIVGAMEALKNSGFENIGLEARQ